MIALIVLSVLGSALAQSSFNPAFAPPPSASRNFASASAFAPAAAPAFAPASPSSFSALPSANAPVARNFASSSSFGASPLPPVFNPASRQFVNDAPASAPAFAPAPAPAFAPAASPSFVSSPVVNHPAITVVERSYLSDESGQFSSSYKGSDGSSFSEVGRLHPTNDHTDNVIVKEGVFSYVSPEGVPVQISYVADEYGFHPVGNVLPVAPVAAPPTF